MNNRIQPEQRPQLIERIRQLNAAHLFDSEIGAHLGYCSRTIRLLRDEGGIPPVERAVRSELWSSASVDCPRCRSSVNVLRGVVEDHRGFLGRLRAGTHAADPCPASGKAYALLVAEQLVPA